jgi:hypothetical protein
MPISIIEALSVPSGAVNDDCVGNKAALAWVIDGATDVTEEPLVGTASDAAWFALALDAAFRRQAHDPPADLARLPVLVAPELADEFERNAHAGSPRRVTSIHLQQPSSSANATTSSNTSALAIARFWRRRRLGWCALARKQQTLAIATLPTPFVASKSWRPSGRPRLYERP